MNCANHPDRERAAFCQNCGKPICAECIRTLGTSTYCELCYTARTAAPVPPGAPYAYPLPPRDPSPGLAALLGFIPGVGAMYNEQYAKGIVHLMVFAVLVSLSHDVGIFGLFVAGWIFYMVIEAYHTARARRDGTPLPNPFGLNDIGERLGFGHGWPASSQTYTRYTAPPNPDPTSQPTGGQDPPVPPGTYGPPPTYPYASPVAQWGAPQESYVPPIPPVPPVNPYVAPDVPPQGRHIPSGAIWLIALGVIFLLGNLGMFHVVRMRYLAPLVLIGVGVWLFVQKMLSSGEGLENDGTPYYRWRFTRALFASVWVVLIGVIWLLDSLRILTWSRSWPLFLIAGGVMLFFKRTMSPDYPIPPQYPQSSAQAPSTTSSSLVTNEPSHDHTGNGEERR